MDEDLSVVPAIEDNDLTGTQSTSIQTTDEASEAGMLVEFDHSVDTTDES